MESKNLKVRTFQLFFTFLLAFCFVTGGFAPAFADPKENPPGPAAGGPGMGPKAHKHMEQWKAMSPEKRYEHATKKVEKLKAKREKMVAKKAPDQAIKRIDKRIKYWETWINKYNKKHKK